MKKIWAATCEQIVIMGINGIPMVLLCISFASVVTILESSFHMKLVIQNDALVPGFAALLILRELGAVITGLLLTSRAGAGIAAEIGTMQTTEQIDALRMLGINPVQFLVLPRFLAGVISLICLVALANFVCILSSVLICNWYLGFTPNMFFSAMLRFVSAKDLFFSLIKAGFFGATIPLVSCYFGFRAQASAKGVGSAATQSVVVGSILIIVLDFLLTYTFSYFY